MYKSTRFGGFIEIKSLKLPVKFDIEIDENGELKVTLDPFPTTKEAFNLERLSSGLGRRANPATLIGNSKSAHHFQSDRFFITGHRTHTGPESPNHIIYSGQCTVAELRLPRPLDQKDVAVRWLFRRFRTFRAIHETTDIGEIIIAGASPEPEKPQRLTGQLMIKASEGGPEWFETALDHLDHIARVMSFACGLYLKPYIEHRFTHGDQIIIINRHGAAPQPQFGAFHFLHFNDIFHAACNTPAEIREKLKELDPTVQWVLTPAEYTEIRLMGAMTAIESLLNKTMSKAQKHFMSANSFSRLASALRTFLRDNAASEGVMAKIPELNRRSFEEKLNAYIAERRIDLSDLPEDSIRRITTARNNVVHRGAYDPDETKERGSLFDHALLAREITIRMLLDVLQFRGQYMSAYFNDKFLDFPNPQIQTES